MGGPGQYAALVCYSGLGDGIVLALETLSNPTHRSSEGLGGHGCDWHAGGARHCRAHRSSYEADDVMPHNGGGCRIVCGVFGSMVDTLAVL